MAHCIAGSSRVKSIVGAPNTTEFPEPNPPLLILVLPTVKGTAIPRGLEPEKSIVSILSQVISKPFASSDLLKFSIIPGEALL